MSKVRGNVFFLIVNQGVNYLMPLLVFPFLVRMLGPEKFGMLSFSMATTQFFILFTDYGFNFSATKNISINRTKKAEISKIYWEVTFSKVILCIFSFVVMIFLTTTFSAYENIKTMLFINFITVIGTVIYPIWLFQGLEEMKFITLFSVISRIFTLPLFYFFVKDPSDIYLAILFLSMPNLLAGIVATVYIKWARIVIKTTITMAGMKKTFMEGREIFASTLLTSMYTLLTPVAVGFISGPIVVGYFNIANTIKQAICGAFTPVIQAYFPRVSALYIENSDLSKKISKKILTYLTGILLIISFSIFFFADIVVAKGFGENYMGAVPILKILSFVPVFIIANSVMGLLMMIPRGDTQGYMHSISKGSISSLLILIPSIYLLGGIGGAITLLLTEIVVGIFMSVKILNYAE